ncbi:uncharacterized protein HMPREF1541_07283 [Cyphellophora europaea CBS 101466]|uniref:Uncharacterized protein n=1 Tax=Cyphellophora europaea (strain CBS 101466) TaxID=1220924 RepID=W2RMV6_CYPE1|nr:uncharacterized protein HMPREF1541_07283 [Cyphellophora europaea CBS 101466]ETN37660.1 hypothetical protein HMPREF1541_07283 [Cyphellophora europaea CBS 101466]
MAQPTAHALVDTIKNGHFFDIDESSLLSQVQVTFASELERLKHAAASERPTSHVRAQAPSPSMILYNHEYDEINRTVTGILCLRWIYNGDYDHFTRNQPDARRLTEDSFAWLRDYFRQNLGSTQDVLLLVISMVINDLGKDPNLEQQVKRHFEAGGRSLPDQNHDSILYEAASIGIIDCLSLLDESQMVELKLGLALGAELNAGQLAQAESVPINLEFLQEMQGQEHAFELKFMEQMLDVAGALGHVNSDGAMNLIQPVFETFQTVHDVSVKIIREDMPLREAYDRVLRKRNKLLVNVGFRRLSVTRDEDRALLRLLTMGRTVDKEQADLFAEAFNQLESTSRDFLIKGLNIDGNVNERAVLPYYMPAVFADTLQKTKGCTKDDRRKALTSLMRYLAKVFEQSPKFEVNGETREDVSTPVPGIVIEHNMMKVREVINSDGFPENPDRLDDLDIPPAQQLLRRRTSHSLASGENEYFPKPISRTGTNLSAPPAPINEAGELTHFNWPRGTM